MNWTKKAREHRPSSQARMLHYYSHFTLFCVFLKKTEKSLERFFWFKCTISVILWQSKTENSSQKERNYTSDL